MSTPVLTLNGTEIVDTFAEAFGMTATSVVVTATNRRWVEIATQSITGYATSVIGCDSEAGLDQFLSPNETPDGRPGASLLFFAFSRDALQKALVNRVGQCLLTCATTAVYAGWPAGEKSIRIGGNLRYFGDGWQISKLHEGRRYWRIPTMDGEFVCEDAFGTTKGVAGGNLILMGTSQKVALAAAEQAVLAAQAVPGVMLPFPGGVVRSGSKVGSRYRALRASTNEAFCPTLRAVVSGSEVHPQANGLYELVMDGITQEALAQAMRAALYAAAGPGILRITAGNYGGKLGPYHLKLHDLVATTPKTSNTAPSTGAD